MTLDELWNIGGLVGGLAVVLTLVYLARRRRPSVTGYDYYIVENNFAARVKQGTGPAAAERLGADGRWVPYDDVWDVCTNGRYVKTEYDAMCEAKDILNLRGTEHQIVPIRD